MLTPDTGPEPEEPARLPRSATILDIVTWLCAALVLLVTGFGGIVLFEGRTRLSITSTTRLLLVGAAAAVLRHALVPSPTALV